MMGYRYGGIMSEVGIMGFLTWLAVLADLVLLGMWLYKQIKK